MNIGERIKIISAILLVVCVTLPISSCTKYEDPNGGIIIKYDPKTYPNAKRTIIYNYPLERFNPKDFFCSWLLLFCFIWPIPIILYRHKGNKKLIKNILWTIEPLFALGSSYWIWIDASVFAKPFIGAYLAIIANGIYVMTWLSELAILSIHKYQHRWHCRQDIGGAL